MQKSIILNPKWNLVFFTPWYTIALQFSPYSDVLLWSNDPIEQWEINIYDFLKNWVPHQKANLILTKGMNKLTSVNANIPNSRQSGEKTPDGNWILRFRISQPVRFTSRKCQQIQKSFLEQSVPSLIPLHRLLHGAQTHLPGLDFLFSRASSAIRWLSHMH